ncbi:serine/threonine protein kinase [Brazilian marseillevirus]|uniref:serine/threonine protein kinase n=1 Tax=Brazilian marseillevirus TaxID=1813599 RepID=UPI000784DB82|nr:serine/threonine protein kinase [Brazilian marseillevirus]AMQ10748.1 serine/threonine protein kinase [Brazilian marseillevirus]
MKTFFPEEIRGYKRKHLIGSGSESQVWLYKKDGQSFAVKYGTSDPEIPEHPNICRVIEKIKLEENSWTVMEYLGSISVYDIICRKPLEETTAICWFRQLCKTLDFVQDHGISHCDIKCENIMIHKRTPKLIDWGYSEVRGSEKKSAKGSFEYCAPEVFGQNPEERDLFACDVWSLGVVLFCMLTSTFPFHGRNVRELLNCIKERKFLLDLPKKQREFFFWLFQRKPRKRPTIKKILEHPYLMGQYQSIPSSEEVEQKKEEQTKGTPLLQKQKSQDVERRTKRKASRSL